MVSSLISEKLLVLSPSLAATIGLEEAIMLQALSDRTCFNEGQLNEGKYWFALEKASVTELFPFWAEADIQRVVSSLRDKGIVTLTDDSFIVTGKLIFSLDEGQGKPQAIPIIKMPPNNSKEAVPKKDENTFKGAQAITADWRPGKEQMKQIAQYGISVSFVEEHLPEFISYWMDRGEAHHSWGSKFLKQVVRKWRESETLFAAQDRVSELSGKWVPSEDAYDIMLRTGITRAFIEEAIPEFVLYWRERGESSATWNSKFIQHIRRQWARYCSAIEHDTEPQRISNNWQPSADVFDILVLANIDEAFARSLIPEFTVYWRDSNQLHASWNSKFLQHVKYHWAKQHQVGANGGHAKTAEQDFVQLHTDSSWADGL